MRGKSSVQVSWSFKCNGKCESGGILQVGTYTLWQLCLCQFLEEDTEVGVTGGELRYQKQDYHLHTMKCATQSSHYPGLKSLR